MAGVQEVYKLELLECLVIVFKTVVGETEVKVSEGSLVAFSAKKEHDFSVLPFLLLNANSTGSLVKKLVRNIFLLEVCNADSFHVVQLGSTKVSLVIVRMAEIDEALKPSVVLFCHLFKNLSCSFPFVKKQVNASLAAVVLEAVFVISLDEAVLRKVGQSLFDQEVCQLDQNLILFF